jgi:hypothetical protein
MIDRRRPSIIPRKRNIPPDIELRLARAVAADRKANAHLNDIWTLFWSKFRPVSPLDHFSIMGTSKGIWATIFLVKNSDIAECEASGMNQMMRDFIWDKLEEFGRAKRGDTNVTIEFDSYENVEKHYRGSYQHRLH